MKKPLAKKRQLSKDVVDAEQKERKLKYQKMMTKAKAGHH